MRWLWLVACAGCAGGEVADAIDGGPDGFVIDATVSSTGGQGGMIAPPVGGMPGAGGMPDPPVGGMPPDPPVGGMGGMPPGDCMPGQRLGLCSVCGNDGSARNPGFDANCPVDCAGFEYTQVDAGDGTIVCTLTERAAMNDMGPCQDLGVCEDDPAVLCGEPNTQQMAQTMPCQIMDGCAGEDPPQVMPAPDGTACGDEGMCMGGTCEENNPCDISESPANAFAREFCGEGVDGANGWCEWYVDGPGDRYSCIQFCLAVGMTCMMAWNNDNFSCVHNNDPWGCDQRKDDQICRCAF